MPANSRWLTETTENPVLRSQPAPPRIAERLLTIGRISHVKRHAVQITPRDGENGGSSPPIADYLRMSVA
jgi:hypothetical protein